MLGLHSCVLVDLTISTELINAAGHFKFNIAPPFNATKPKTPITDRKEVEGRAAELTSSCPVSSKDPNSLTDLDRASDPILGCNPFAALELGNTNSIINSNEAHDTRPRLPTLKSYCFDNASGLPESAKRSTSHDPYSIDLYKVNELILERRRNIKERRVKSLPCLNVNDALCSIGMHCFRRVRSLRIISLPVNYSNAEPFDDASKSKKAKGKQGIMTEEADPAGKYTSFRDTIGKYREGEGTGKNGQSKLAIDVGSMQSLGPYGGLWLRDFLLEYCSPLVLEELALCNSNLTDADLLRINQALSSELVLCSDEEESLINADQNKSPNNRKGRNSFSKRRLTGYYSSSDSDYANGDDKDSDCHRAGCKQERINKLCGLSKGAEGAEEVENYRKPLMADPFDESNYDSHRKHVNRIKKSSIIKVDNATRESSSTLSSLGVPREATNVDEFSSSVRKPVYNYLAQEKRKKLALCYNLKILRLANHRIGYEGCASLSKVLLLCSRLNRLVLRNCFNNPDDSFYASLGNANDNNDSCDDKFFLVGDKDLKPLEKGADNVSGSIDAGNVTNLISGFDQIAKALPFCSLVSLDISDNENTIAPANGEEFMRTLFLSLADCHSLRYLWLSHNCINNDKIITLSSLIKGGRLRELRHIDLSWNDIGPEGIAALLAALAEPVAFRRIPMGHSSPSQGSAVHIHKAPLMESGADPCESSPADDGGRLGKLQHRLQPCYRQLKYFDITGNLIGSVGFSVLADFIAKIRTVKTLLIGDNFCTYLLDMNAYSSEEDGSYLAGDNCISINAAPEVLKHRVFHYCQHNGTSRVEERDFSQHFRIIEDYSGLIDLTHSLQFCPRLKNISLSSSFLRDRGAKILFSIDSIRYLSFVKRLYIKDNFITDNGLTSIMSELKTFFERDSIESSNNGDASVPGEKTRPLGRMKILDIGSNPICDSKIMEFKNYLDNVTPSDILRHSHYAGGGHGIANTCNIF